MKTIDPADKFKASFKELIAIFENVEAGVMAQPLPDLSRVKDDDLIMLIIVYWAAGRNGIIKIIDGQGHSWKFVYERANLTFENLDATRLAALFLFNPDLKPIHHIMRQYRRWFYAYQEMVHRIQKLKLGHEVAEASWELGNHPTTPLMASLKTHPRLKGLMRRKNLKRKAYDVKEEAEARAYERYREITEDAANLIEISDATYKLPKDRVKLWALLDPILLELELRDFFKHYLPVLQGEYEKFSATVYESVRWWVEKLKREEGESLTSQYEDAESGDTEEGESRAVQKKWAEEYFEQENSATEMSDPDILHRKSMVLDWVEKHLNEKGRRYVVARIIYGKTATDASKDAGVSRVTGRKYELELIRAPSLKEKGKK